jgi:hypothetical protein
MLGASSCQRWSCKVAASLQVGFDVGFFTGGVSGMQLAHSYDRGGGVRWPETTSDRRATAVFARCGWPALLTVAVEGTHAASRE